MMRTLPGLCALVAITACADRRPAPKPPTADSAISAPAADSATMPRPPGGDSVMARDTARAM